MECPAFDARRDAREEASGAPQTPIVYALGEASNVWDVDGNRYVDLAAGFGALVLGHSPTVVREAVVAQETKLGLALGDVYASDVKVELCERLAALFPEPARVMLGLSGADALTAALKTVALTGKSRVVAFEGSYHGLLYGPLAACGLGAGFRAPFREHTGDWVTFEPYPSTSQIAGRVLASLRAFATTEDGRRTGAVLIEPVLGRGGIVEAAPGFLRDLRALADELGWLLVADEIFTGFRGGALSLTLAAGIVPDVLCLGKGLGAGEAISAIVARDAVMKAWGAHGGTAIHTATHFGSPPVCAAALAVLGAFADGTLYATSERTGAIFQAELEKVLRGKNVAVRRRGLMIGLDFGSSARALATSRKLLERGYIVVGGGADGASFTLTPALTIAPELLAGFATALGQVLEASS